MRFIKSFLAALLIAALIAGLTGVGAAVASPGKEKPITPGGIKSITFVHYAKGGKPGAPPSGDGDKVMDAYALMGPRWAATPLSYVINPSGSPAGAADAMKAAFEAWDLATSAELFDDAVVMDSSARASLDYPDYVNTVSWRGISPPSTIAITNVWYQDNDASGGPSSGDEIVDADMIFNSLLKWGVDTDGEGTAYVLKKQYDVRNIATHEAGHVVGLDDLYADSYSELTMYGYSRAGETKKVSLELGDRLGVQALYGS